MRGPCFHLGDPLEGKPGCHACLHERHDQPTTIQQCKECFDYDLRLARGTVRKWVVGLTTAPREESTVEESIRSLAAAGWGDPHVFAEPHSPIPDCVEPQNLTVRPQTMGAWPNWLLSATELYLRSPQADAYLIVQDDVVYAQGLREYLEKELWPAERLGIVALHTASHWGHRAPARILSDRARLGCLGGAGLRHPESGPPFADAKPAGAEPPPPRTERRDAQRGFGAWDVVRGTSACPTTCTRRASPSTLARHRRCGGRRRRPQVARRAATFPGEDADIREAIGSGPLAQDVPETDVPGDADAETRSLAVVCVLIGKRDPFDDWSGWMLGAVFPPQTTLYLVDNSADAEFAVTLAGAVDAFSQLGTVHGRPLLHRGWPCEGEEALRGALPETSPTLSMPSSNGRARTW